MAKKVKKAKSAVKKTAKAKKTRGGTLYPVVPPKVEYQLTELGSTLSEAFCGVWIWADQNLAKVEAARRTFDKRASER